MGTEVGVFTAWPCCTKVLTASEFSAMIAWYNAVILKELEASSTRGNNPVSQKYAVADVSL